MSTEVTRECSVTEGQKEGAPQLPITAAQVAGETVPTSAGSNPVATMKISQSQLDSLYLLQLTKINSY